MNTDDIFKLPSLPASGSSLKRKFTAPVPPSLSDITGPGTDNHADKVPKVAPSSSANGVGKGKGKQVTIEELKEDGSSDQEEEEERGEFAPGGDADYFVEEDEEEGGRFFGGGLTTTQKEVLNIMDQGDLNERAGEMTISSIRKSILVLEKAINKNRDMRTKFGGEPEKFVDSEYHLLTSISSLLLLSTAPSLSYPLLLELSTLTSLADLLMHENTDVVIAVIELIEEWTDEEVLEVDDEEEEGEGETERRKEAMSALIEGLGTAGVIDLLVSGLERLKESDETERGGVFHTLGLLENLLTLSPLSLLPQLSPFSPLLSYLLTRISLDKLPAEMDQNRYYAAEVLAILIGMEGDEKVGLVLDAAKERVARGAGGGVDGVLRVLSIYRRRDPSTPSEHEFFSELFNILCSLLSHSSIKAAFLIGEGVELMVLMLSEEKRMAKGHALKVLDYAMMGREGMGACEKFVEVGGLKGAFKAFVGKGAHNKKSDLPSSVLTEHVLSLLSSLLTSLPSDSPARLRLLAKFVESDYTHIDRLIELREEVEGRVILAAEEGEGEGEGEEEESEEEKYVVKLGAGLFSLQRVDYIVGWLCMEDDGMRDHILMLLQRKDRSFSDIMRVLIEYRENINVPPPSEVTEEAEDADDRIMEEGEEQREILAELITYLQSVDI